VTRNAYAQDERERPPALTFPLREELRVSRAGSSAVWVYESPLYRKVAVGAAEPKTEIEILGHPGKAREIFEGEDAGTLRFTRKCGGKGGSLTVVLAFDKRLDEARRLLAESTGKTVSPGDVQERWRRWFEEGQRRRHLHDA
jgi:hypothetical protein